MKEKFNIKQFDPCTDALVYYNSCVSTEEAWNNCPRGDWMLWIASKLKVDKRKLFLAKGKCAETVIHLMWDKRSIDAVNATIAYGLGNISDEELKRAAAAAAAAYAAADAATAKVESQKQTADICREILTNAIFDKIKEYEQ